MWVKNLESLDFLEPAEPAQVTTSAYEEQECPPRIQTSVWQDRPIPPLLHPISSPGCWASKA